MKKNLTVDIVFPVYYDNIDILEDSTKKVLMYLKNTQCTFIFNIIIISISNIFISILIIFFILKTHFKFKDCMVLML